MALTLAIIIHTSYFYCGVYSTKNAFALHEIVLSKEHAKWGNQMIRIFHNVHQAR